MADLKITQLPSASAATGSNVLPIVQGGATEQITVDNLAIGIFDSTTASSYVKRVTGSWTLTPGANTVSFTVTAGQSYTMWVNGNIPNGIVTWNATVTTSNTNVPAVGSQYGWYYIAGGALVLTSIPSQIVGENGIIVTTSPATTTSNVFTFGITNNTITNQTVNYGYIKL